MPQDIRRRFLLQVHVYRYGMSLVCPDQCVVLIEGVPLLLICSDDFFQNLYIKCMAFRLIDAVNQFPDIRPAMLIQGNPDRFRLMAQDQP